MSMEQSAEQPSVGLGVLPPRFSLIPNHATARNPVLMQYLEELKVSMKQWHLMGSEKRKRVSEAYGVLVEYGDLVQCLMNEGVVIE